MSDAPGLSRFAIRGGGFCEGDVGLVHYELRNSPLIVDGSSLACRLFDSRDRRGKVDVTNKVPDDSERWIRELFESFLEHLSQVIIVIRDEQREPDIRAYASSKNIRAPLQAPSDLVKIICSVATKMKIRIKSCKSSIYDPVAELSLEHQCPVLSDDGYFFRKAPPYGMIPWGSYNHKSKSCELFRLDQKSLLDSELSQAKLGLIDVLSGSVSSEDANQRRVFRLIQNKLVSIVGPGDCKRFKGGGRNKRILAGVLSHLCEKTYEEAREYVVNLVDKSDRKTVEAIINRGSHDLAFYQTAGELREAIEDICGCQHHNQVRAAQWIDWLYMQTRRPIPPSSALFLPLRIQLTRNKQTNTGLSQSQRRGNLLRGLHISVKSYNRRLKLWPGVKDDPEDAVVHEFFIVKLLLSALDIESAKRKLPVKFVRATLSCLIYYLGGNNNFLADYRERLVEEIDDFGNRLRTPLRNISACEPEIFEHMETLIELIWTFNELNALAGHPIRRLMPEKWLNICLLYNISVGTLMTGKMPPEFKMKRKPSPEIIHIG